MTDFLSQSPSSEKLHVETKLAIRILPDAVRGKGKARNFFGKQFQPWPFVTALLQVQYTLCREGQMFRRRSALQTGTKSRRSSIVTCLFPLPGPAGMQPLNPHPTRCNTGLKAKAGLAHVVLH